MVAGVLGVCDLWLGHTVPGGAENIRGFFENVALRERLQKEILRQGGFDPLGVRRLPSAGWHPGVRMLREAVAAALAAQGYDARQTWGFKDAKLTLTWRVWHEHFPQARWIIVRRPSEQVIASCIRTSFMKQHSLDPTYWRSFVDAYLERLEMLKQGVGWHRVVDSTDIIGGNLEPLQTIVEELGLTWRPDAVRDFVAPEHWHAPPPPG